LSPWVFAAQVAGGVQLRSPAPRRLRGTPRWRCLGNASDDVPAHLSGTLRRMPLYDSEKARGESKLKAAIHLASIGGRTGESVRHAKINSLDRLRGRASIETTTGPGADHGINPGLVIALQGALNRFDQIDG